MEPTKQQLFLKWIDKIEKDNNWTDNQFALSAGLSHTVLSKARSQGMVPKWDACAALADAASMPREQVFRAAGLMKPNPSLSPIKEELLHWVDQMNDEDAADIVAMAEAKVRRKASGARGTVKKK